MARFVVLLSLFLSVGAGVIAQTTQPSTSQISSASDPQALALAVKSVMAMTRGSVIRDVKITASVTWIAGSDREIGTGTFLAKGANESRVDLDLDSGDRTEIRSSSEGAPTGKWKRGQGKVASVAQHNCWTDAVWFFPALSSLTQTTNSNFTFQYFGQEQRDGLAVLHLRIAQHLVGDTAGLNLSRLTVMDFYLDPSSLLPLAVAYNLHPDDNFNRDIPAEIRFTDYRLVDGVQVPFHIQRLLNGGLLMDAIVSEVNANSGLNDTQFTLQ